ncbi:hypothetical protein KC887_01175 [Candidatus Kaiserbacteria bacterium]|nr:hypothetical protein [Candidatus Kaiserbacteria bacterium]
MTTPIDIIFNFKKTGQGDDQAIKALKDIEKNSAGASSGAAKAAGGMTSLSGAVKGLVAGGALLTAGKALLDFGKASITAASDVQEMQSKFNTVFGELGGKVTGELGNFADASNRSKTELMGFAATIQDTLKPMGIAADEAANFSVDLVKLGTDLASFNNMPMDEAMRRLQGTLIGSHENALAFGVVINENTLKAELAARGWDKLSGAQLEAAKVQARINLLMAGTTDAQGDAIKTADSYANQVKGMQAAMTDLQVTVGSALLPAMTELVGLVTAVADRLDIAAGAAGKYGDEVSQIIDANIESAKSFDDLVNEAQKIDEVRDIWGGLGPVVTGTSGAIRDGIASLAPELARSAGSFEEFYGAFSSLSRASQQDIKNFVFAQGLTIEQFYEMEKATMAAEEATARMAAETSAADSIMLRYGPDVGRTAEEIIAYSQAAAAAAGPNEDLADKTAMLGNHMTAAEASIAAANRSAEQNAQANEEAAAAAAEFAAAQAELARATGDTFTALASAEGPLGIFDQALGDIGQQMVAVGGRTADQNADLARLQEAYNKAAGTVRDYELGVKGANLSDEARAAKIAEQQQLMAGLAANMEPLLAVTSEYVSVNNGLTVNQDALNAAMYAAADNAGANAGALALLKVATGELSEAQAEAIIRQIALEQTLTTLAEAYAQGDITLQDYMSSAQQAVTDISNMAVNFDTMTGSVTTSKDSVNDLVGVMGEIPSEISTHISVTSDPVPTFPGSRASGGAGPAQARADGGLITGGTPITGYGRDNVAIAATTGEYVLKPDAVRKLGLSRLNHMNSTGRLPGFADGGYIGDGSMTSAGGTSVMFAPVINVSGVVDRQQAIATGQNLLDGLTQAARGRGVRI